MNINKKLYNLNDTRRGFYSKENESRISERWDKKAKLWDNQLENKDSHLNKNGEYDNFIYISKKIASLPNYNIDTFLEIGCGTGLVSRALSPYFKKGIGIDISSNMISEARKKNISNMNFHKKSFFNLDKNIDGSFDLIVSRGILVSHYGIEYLNEILEVIFNVTKNHGYVIFDFLNKKAILEDVHLPQNKEYYLHTTIVEYALKIGFTNVEIYGKSTGRVLIAILNK